MDAEKSSNSSFEDLSTEIVEKSISNSDAQQEKGAVESSEKLVESDKPETATDKSKESKEKVGHGEQQETSSETATNSEEQKDGVCDILGNGELILRTIKANKSAPRANRLDSVVITYTGKLVDGTVVESKENFEIHVGDYEVVQGLDMAIPLMHVGEEAEVTVKSRFAYGAQGNKSSDDTGVDVPPDATIIYNVRLLKCESEEFEHLKSFEVRRTLGQRKKERANFWYNRGEYNTAIQLYRRALDYLDTRDGDPDAVYGEEDLKFTNQEAQTLLEDRLVVYNNLAMAQIKISAFDAALKSVDTVLQCQPRNAKALYRKGRILENKGDTKGAISMLQKAASLEKEKKLSKTIENDLAKLLIRARREEHNEKELYQKMMGQANKLEQKSKQNQKTESVEGTRFKFLGFLMGTILIGVAGVALYRYKY